MIISNGKMTAFPVVASTESTNKLNMLTIFLRENKMHLPEFYPIEIQGQQQNPYASRVSFAQEDPLLQTIKIKIDNKYISYDSNSATRKKIIK